MYTHEITELVEYVARTFDHGEDIKMSIMKEKMMDLVKPVALSVTDSSNATKKFLWEKRATEFVK